MKITFPQLGNVYIAAKAFMEELGQEVIPPPRCSQKTLEIGTKYSPEMMCLPFKINIGNYIESIEKGADTILITGSCGPCRFGYYSVLEENLLRDLGYEVDFIVFDPIYEGVGKLKNNIEKIFDKNNIRGIVKAGNLGWKLIRGADELTQLSNEIRAYAYDSYEVDMVMEEYYKNIYDVYGAKEMINLIDQTVLKLKNIKINEDKNPIRIGIIGEIYTIIEPFVNLEIERKLGHMGVLVDKSLTPTKWVEHHIARYPFGSKVENRKYKFAKPYIETLVGGHGRETIGSAIYYSEKGFDGVIHILPLNCMPEIVAKSILPTVQKDYDFPIMTLVVDEMTGEAGFITRIEAFVDLLEKRRETKNNEELLYGY
ncbi:MAG TPA: 2-hydroxyacyl-CoA dehydratase [Tissierellales bacterium]|nr:2-hydroxyacyl-CoA dehydratase [Tissierellales bacterium]